jgi:hypothetical protein
MSNSRVNKYRSSKNPERQVLTSENTDGTFTTVVFDTKNARIMSHTFPGPGSAGVVEQEPDREETPKKD